MAESLTLKLDKSVYLSLAFN